MSLYEINEATLRLPDEWADQTVNVLASSPVMPAEFSLVINRDVLKDGEKLDDHLTRQHAPHGLADPTSIEYKY